MNYKTKKIDKMGDYSSMTALIKIYNDKVDKNAEVEYGYEVCAKYLNNDEVAKNAIDEWINNIVTQLIAITVTYNPEIICIGGGISEEDWFINKLKKQYKKNGKSSHRVTTDVITSVCLHVCKSSLSYS